MAMTQEVKDFVITTINQTLNERFGDFTIKAGSDELLSLKALPEVITAVRTMPEMKAGMTKLETDLNDLKQKLESIVPSIQGEVEKMNSGQAAVQSTIAQLESRNTEVSDALKKTFKDIDEQVDKLKVQADSASMVQQNIHDISARQLHDIHGLRNDVERKYVRGRGVRCSS